MGGIQRRKRNTAKNKKFHRQLKTKSYQRDADQIYEDMKPENYETKKKQPIDETLPNLGQSYCVACARYFVNDDALTVHEKSKKHKQAMKRIRSQPFTHKDAEEAAKY